MLLRISFKDSSETHLLSNPGYTATQFGMAGEEAEVDVKPKN